MLRRTEGIVLKSAVFGEADLIVTYFTRDYGLMKVFAKSPRKIKSRFGSSLEPLTYSRLSFIGREDANLPRLTQSDIIRPFYSLREDIKCLVNISEMLTLGINFLPDREPNQDIFRLLLGTMLKLESDSGNKLYYLYFKMKFLEFSGYSPRLDICGICGDSVVDKRDSRQGTSKAKPHTRQSKGLPEHFRFYAPEGAVICHKCKTGDGAITLSIGAMMFYRSLLKWDVMTIGRINIPEYFVSEIDSIINSHTKYILNK